MAENGLKRSYTIARAIGSSGLCLKGRGAQLEEAPPLPLPLAGEGRGGGGSLPKVLTVGGKTSGCPLPALPRKRERVPTAPGRAACTYRASALIMSAAFSAIIITAAAVLAETMVGITEASTTRRPSRPMTLRRGSTTAAGPVPMAQVPTGW